MRKLLLILMVITAASTGVLAADTTSATTAPLVNRAQVTVSGVSTQKAGQVIALKNPNPVEAVTLANAAANCLPVNDTRKTVGWILITLIVVSFVIIAAKSNLLRDQITDTTAFMANAAASKKYAAQTDINKIPKPFSLARTQLGVWTVIIGCSYIYLSLCKYFSLTDIPIDSSLLTLMGISAATTAAGSIIDNDSSVQNYNGPSDGLFMDILSDQNGVNIHRFQNVVWTLITVILFLCKVPEVGCGELPTLSTTLIVLTGISSATYVGLKINENKPPALPPPANNAPEQNNPPVNVPGQG